MKNIVEQIVLIIASCEKEYASILAEIQNPHTAKVNSIHTLQMFANKIQLYKDLVNHCGGETDKFTKSIIMGHYYSACDNMARHSQDSYKMTYEAYKFLLDRYCTPFK
jgi:hypothetical protein